MTATAVLLEKVGVREGEEPGVRKVAAKWLPLLAAAVVLLGKEGACKGEPVACKAVAW